MKNDKWAATTFLDGFRDQRFAKIAKLIEAPRYLETLPRKKFNPWVELKFFFQLVKESWGAKVLLFYSTRGYLKPELLLTLLIGFLPKRIRPAVIIYGEMYAPNEGRGGGIERFVMRLVDRGVALYSVYSTEELTLFPQLWGVAPQKMRLCRLFMLPERASTPSEVEEVPGRIFAGGNSFRNYEPLIEAARQLPEYQFILASVHVEGRTDLPLNVCGEWVSLEEYIQLMSTAEMVVVPLQTGLKRTVGLLTTMEALTLGKVVLVTNALGISDYVVDRETGLIVDSDPQSFVEAIRWVSAPENKEAVQKMKDVSKEYVLQEFSIESFVTQMLAIFDEALAIRENWRS